MDDEPGVDNKPGEHLEDGGGGNELRGELRGAEGHTLRDGGAVQHSVQPGGGGGDLKEFVRQSVHLQSESEEAADPVLPDGDVQRVRGGDEQSPVANKKRRYFRKLRGGVSRNGYLQTNILNFTVPKMVVGDISANDTKTETGTRLRVAGSNL